MNDIGMKKLFSIFIIGLFLAVTCWAQTPVVKLETNFGDIVIELFDANAPITVANFLGYVKSGFYDGLIFHRVEGYPVDSYPNDVNVIQGGSFDVYYNARVPEPNIINESYNHLSNLRGTVAMARDPNADSATSGFYINWLDNTNLDRPEVPATPNDVGYCVFGRVISDMNVIDRIAHLPTVSNFPSPPGPVIIYNAKILGDLDGDPNVNLKDYSAFAAQWLDSGNSGLFEVTDGNAGDWFGYSVAADGNHVIIGAPDDNNYTGAAYIYEYNDGIWTRQARLTANDGSAGDYFGNSVSISYNYAIVGAVGDDNNMGSAYLFRNNDGNWTWYGTFFAPDDDKDDWFGQSVAISGDCVVVGAFQNDAAGINSGSVYVFYRNQPDVNKWGELARLEAADAASQDRFGYSVSINGEYIIVGAIGDDSYKGSAYIFKYKNSAWTQLAKLTATDGASSDKFGWSVSTDGHYAIAGARLNDEKGSNAGAAYIFEPNEINPDNWDQKAKLTASDAAANDYFGNSVAVGYGHAIVGAYGNDDNGSSSGSAYIFEPNEVNPDNWVQLTKLTASDADANDYFGFSAAIGIGRKAIVGAQGNDDKGADSGSAYIFKLCPDADFDGDCSVTLNDLAILTDNWLLH